MPKRILIVDDEPDLIEVLSLIFRTYGYTVETASDGREALQAVAEARPDVILLDVMMPRMGGIEACRILKAQPETRDLPIVMLTARALDSDRSAGLGAGADAYVPKPFENAELLDTVRRALKEA